MSDSIGARFRKGMGKPKPAVNPDIPLDPYTATGSNWNDIKEETGAGYFLNGFLYLFGADIREWDPCVEAWSFLYPRPEAKRLLIGKNAYGSLIILEDPEKSMPLVGILDIPTVTYYSHRDLDFYAFLNSWLPERQGPEEFWRTDIYDAFAAKSKEPLGMDALLGMTIPLELGGDWSFSNFEVREPVEYHQKTAAAIKEGVAGSEARKQAKKTQRKKPGKK
jgi:hypothetical protein